MENLEQQLKAFFESPTQEKFAELKSNPLALQLMARKYPNFCGLGDWIEISKLGGNLEPVADEYIKKLTPTFGSRYEIYQHNTGKMRAKAVEWRVDVIENFEQLKEVSDEFNYVLTYERSYVSNLNAIKEKLIKKFQELDVPFSECEKIYNAGEWDDGEFFHKYPFLKDTVLQKMLRMSENW